MAEKTSLVQSPATPTLQALVNELASVENWHLLGVNLGLQGHQLHGIEQNYPRDNDRCKTETLYMWQRNAKNLSWEAVVKALCLMQEHVVADAIRRKYCCSSTAAVSERCALPTNCACASGWSCTMNLQLGSSKMRLSYTIRQGLAKPSVGSLDTSIVPSSDSSSSAIGSQVKTHTPIPPHTVDSLVLAKENLQMIKGKFATLIALAEDVLQGKNIKMSNLRPFLTAHYLPEEDDNDTRAINPSTFVSQVLGAQSVSEILQSLMVHHLLSYKNFYILRSIINHYASDDIEMKTKLDEYEQELAGYFLVTKMKDYLNAEIEQNEHSELDLNLLDELSLKVKANVTEKTVAYVSELWKSLVRQVKLPVTTVLFHRIAEGCVKITWLLPCHLTTFTTRRLEESTNYFQEENILQVTIAGRCVYDEVPSVQDRKEEIHPERKRDPDDPDTGNLSSAQDDPDAENLSSLQRIEQLIGDEPEGPEDIPEHEQGMRCARVVCLNYSLLYSQLDPEKFLSKLLEKDLIDEKQLKQAESFCQRFAKNACVIRLLLWYDRPSHGLLKFCDTLETTPGQDHLGRKLLKDYKHPSPVQVQSPSAETAVHSDLVETSEMFQHLQREVMDLLDQFPNALAKLKQVLASLVLPRAVGNVVPLVDPLAYEHTQTVRELFRLMAPYWNPLSTDLLTLLLEASGCNKAASKVAEFVEARASKGHLVLSIRQQPSLASGENDLNVADLETVHNAPVLQLQSIHPAVFARLPEHKVTSTQKTVRISVEVDKPLVCLADYENITTAVSSFLQVPTIALVYAGCSKAPLVLCWLASHHLVDFIKSSRAGYLLSLCTHQLLAENNVTGIAIGEQTYKCPTIKEVKLWEASQYGLVEHVRYLLATGVNVNMATIDGAVALGRASMNGHQEVVGLLLSARANPDLQKENGWSPLHEACQKGYDGIVVKLLQAGATVDLQEEDGWTSLKKASYNGHQKVVELLLASGANPDLQNKEGYTPLLNASQEGHDGIVEMLLQAGASVDLQAKDGWTSLKRASFNGHQKVVELLLGSGANPDLQDNNGYTPLLSASQEGHDGIVEMLLQAGASVDLQAKNGRTPLMAASYRGHPSVVRVLLQAGATINNTEQSGETALHDAVNQGHEDVVDILLEANIDPDVADKRSQTALMVAAEMGNVGVVRKLIQHGASLNLTNKYGHTAFDLASAKGHMDVCQELLAHQFMT